VSSKLAKVALLIAAVGCTGWAHAHLPSGTRAELGQDFVPAPRVVDVASLGFDALLADYYWLQAVQIVGIADVIDEPIADHVGKLVDVVTTLNPHVDHPYRFAAVWMTHNEEQVREANRLLRRSLEYHGDDWRNHFYLAFNHFFYLDESQQAAVAMERAASLPGSPAYLPRLVARLKSQTGGIDVAEVFLRQLLETTTDEASIAKIQSGLDEIEIEHKARHLDRAREAYRRLAGRDIESVEDLKTGPFRVIEKIPDPEPDAMPASLSRGSVWKVDPKTDRFVSTYLGARYELHFSSADRARLGRWQREKAPAPDAEERSRVHEDG
jgi:hypothetical protein